MAYGFFGAANSGFPHLFLQLRHAHQLCGVDAVAAHFFLQLGVSRIVHVGAAREHPGQIAARIVDQRP